MAKIYCPECDINTSITADTQEPIICCPFCGDSIVPDDDEDDDDDDWPEDDYEDEDDDDDE